MKPWTVAVFAMLALSVVACPRAATPAHTDIHVSHAWIRLLPANLPAGGYAVIRNTGSVDHTLTGASSPDYARVMLHQSSMHDGVSHMRAVKQLTLPAGGSVTLAPGGYHLMLMQARHPVQPGDTVPVILQWADGSTVKVDFQVRPANAHGPSGE